MSNPFLQDVDPGDESAVDQFENEGGSIDDLGEIDPFMELSFSVMMLQSEIDAAIGAIAQALNMLRHAVLLLADGQVEEVKEFLAIPEVEDAPEGDNEA